ncbi:MAG: ERF family protein [Romboutsia timonensis]
MNVYEKLMLVQSKLKAPKGQYNSFGRYSYRSCEDILEALKPLLVEAKAIVNVSDEIKLIGDRYYVEATAMFLDVETGDSIVARASAREDETKKGMDLAQVTGSVSSYARKYALNGLFAIDDNKDPDSTNKHGKDDDIKVNMSPVDKCISDAQLKRLFAIGSKAGFSSDVVNDTIKKAFGCEAKNMTKQQYENICERLEKKGK